MSTLNYLGLSGLKKVFNIIKSYVDNNHMREVTWAELKDLRDNGKLIPGQKYRITDYQCTTTQEDTQSAGHQFDIIVTADSESVLNEEARAIQHEGDTYFANSNLKAWKLWYSLDNDTSRFAWADGTNGKGVVYRMIDEWQNDCPYDFKNIQFDTSYIVTLVKDNPAFSNYKDIASAISVLYTFTNRKGGDTSTNPAAADPNDQDSMLEIAVKNTVGLMSQGLEPFKIPINVFFMRSIRNTFGLSCYDNVLLISYSNTFGDNCHSNTFGNYCYYNTFGDSCNSNTFGDDCNSNTFGDYCESNTFGDSCDSTTFGYDCDSNTLGNYCKSNTFGDNCYSNTFVSFNSNNTTNAYFNYIKIEANIQNIKLINSSTNNDYVKHYHIKSGVTGEFTCEPDRDYETIIAKNSKGQVVEYCEADLISVPLTGIAINGNDEITANGTYNYTVTTTPAYPTDVKSTVWSLGFGSVGTINSSTGVLTVNRQSGNGASAFTTVKVEVTTDSGQVFSATKDVTITIQ